MESIEVSQEALPGDPLVVLNPRAMNGFLTYSVLVPYGEGIVVRHFEDGKQHVVSYSFKFADWEKHGIFDCKRSPDGRYIAFKYGTGFGDVSTYKLCVFDTQTKTLQTASEEFLSFRDFFFSPDGSYIAFVKGGNYRGGTDTIGAKPLQLLYYNVAEDKTKVVPAKGFVPTSLAWLAPRTLYFSAQADTTEKPVSRKKPDLYRFDTLTSKVTLAMKDCYRPVFSPDGKKVAFFGSENPNKPFPLINRWQYVADYMALCVSNLDGSERTALTVEKGSYPKIVWSGSSTALYELQQTQFSPEANLAIIKWDIHTRKKVEVVSLQAKDYEPIQRDETGSSPTFSLISSGGSDDKILIVVDEVTKRDPERPVLDGLQTLQAVDLMDKSVTPLANNRKSFSYHWQGN